MALKQIIITIPEDVLNVLRIDNNELSNQMRYEIAKKYYKDHHLSLGKAASLAGLERLDFFEKLIKENIVIFDYDEIDLETELDGINT